MEKLKLTTLTPAKRAKELGMKNLLEVSELSGKGASTLQKWFREQPEFFDLVVMGCLHKRELANTGNFPIKAMTLEPELQKKLLSALKETYESKVITPKYLYNELGEWFENDDIEADYADLGLLIEAGVIRQIDTTLIGNLIVLEMKKCSSASGVALFSDWYYGM